MRAAHKSMANITMSACDADRQVDQGWHADRAGRQVMVLLKPLFWLNTYARAKLITQKREVVHILYQSGPAKYSSILRFIEHQSSHIKENFT